MTESGWGATSLLFFWWKWRWVHNALGHTITTQSRGTENILVDVCNCGMEWVT